MILPMENTEKMIFPGVGKYGIPEIKPETEIRKTVRSSRNHKNAPKRNGRPCQETKKGKRAVK